MIILVVVVVLVSGVCRLQCVLWWRITWPLCTQYTPYRGAALLLRSALVCSTLRWPSHGAVHFQTHNRPLVTLVSSVIHCLLMLSDSAPLPQCLGALILSVSEYEASECSECWLDYTIVSQGSRVRCHMAGMRTVQTVLCTLCPRTLEPVAESELLLSDLFLFHMWASGW